MSNIFDSQITSLIGLTSADVGPTSLAQFGMLSWYPVEYTSNIRDTFGTVLVVDRFTVVFKVNWS